MSGYADRLTAGDGRLGIGIGVAAIRCEVLSAATACEVRGTHGLFAVRPRLADSLIYPCTVRWKYGFSLAKG